MAHPWLSFAAGALILHPLVAEPPAWQSIPEGRWHPVTHAADSRSGFTSLASTDTGLTFTNHLAELSAANNRILENGSGVALGDIDGDGWCDIYFCRLEGDNVLYRNLGNWRFEDITANSGVACPDQASSGACFADVDGDGDLDLLVTAIGGGTRLFLNDGRGRFTEMTTGRLVRRLGATSMALADMDGDGDLDLYVANYRTDTFRDDPPGLRVEASRQADGTIVVKPEGRFVALVPRGGGVEVIERGERDFLYLNQGGGRFAPVSWTAGAFVGEDGQNLAEAPTDWGLAVQFRDFTGDGLPDLYVCNDFAYWPDRIWINEGGQRFRAATPLQFRHQSLSSMSVDVADINRDGRDDLFIADMMSRRSEWRAWQRPNILEGLVRFPRSDPNFRPEVTHNTLHVARDDGSFAEIAASAGVAASEWTWSAVFLDVDLDGWEDLLTASGNGHDVQHADVLAELAQVRSSRTPANRLSNLQRFPPLPTPLLAFRNRRNHTFTDASSDWRFNVLGVHTGMALGDLDNDGDLDVVLNRLNDGATVLRNNASAPRIGIRLLGIAPNTRGIGARIRVTGGPVVQTQEMIAGGRYLSGDDPIRTFAAGKPDARLGIEITWRSGRKSTVADARPGRVYEISEPDSPPAPPLIPPTVVPLFTDHSTALEHQHVGSTPDEFTLQTLLPRSVNRRGPGIGWFPTTSPIAENLVITAGRDPAPALFSPVPTGAWQLQSNALTSASNPAPIQKEHPAVIVLSDGTPDGWILGLAPAPGAPPQFIPLRTGPAWEGLAPLTQGMNPGALAAADLDGDGRLELFVGDRGIPGQWPASSASRVFTRTQGAWMELQILPDAGMVTGALFTDLDGDGAPDLVTAAEAGEVRVWWNRKGRLEAAKVEGLHGITGWWQCLAAADFDGDGRMDLVAGNWGTNWRAEPVDATQPGVRLAWADFSGGGRIEPLLGAWDPAAGRWFARREWKAVGAVLPWVPIGFPSHAAYGRAGFDELLAGKTEGVKQVLVRTSETQVWLNRGNRFESVPLPPSAQWSSVQVAGTADFDGDGHFDLFLAGNNLSVDNESTRQDAGLGLLLLGDGRGGWKETGPRGSGISIPGETRGIAIGDFNTDGRPDLAVGTYNGPSRIFRNDNTRPGLRLLLDPGTNRTVIGTRIRWISGERAGPLHEIRAGNGSGGQDSFIPILTGLPPDAEVEVRWPDQSIRRHPAPQTGTRNLLRQ